MTEMLGEHLSTVRQPSLRGRLKTRQDKTSGNTVSTERQWAGLLCCQYTASDGRLVTPTPVVVFVVNIDVRTWNALTDFVTAVPSVASFYAALKTYHICFHILFDIQNTCHTDFVTCSCSAVRLHHVNLID